MKKKNWYPLDNAAKLYPAITNERRPNVFCFSCILNEKVNKDKLQEAVDIVLSRTPTFKTKLKKGLFWYYLEQNDKPFIIREEEPNFLRYIDMKENNDYLFKIYYRDNKISIVNFHVLSDGNGVLQVFKFIIIEYLLLTGKDIHTEGKVKSALAPFTHDDEADNYVENYKTKSKKLPKEKRPFKTDGTPFDYDGYGITTGRVDCDKLKKLAKEYNSTITGFLTGLYMFCLYNNFIRHKKVKNKKISILVPADMRKHYPSKTLRNFSLFARPVHDFEQPLDLKGCIETCTRQIKEGVSKERLDALIHDNVKIERNWLLKIVPLFVKDFAISTTYARVGENLQTGNISNIGIADMPTSATPYIKEFNMAIAPTYTCKQQMSVITYNNQTNITITRQFVENNLEREFFTTLASLGLKVNISSNYWEAQL